MTGRTSKLLTWGKRLGVAELEDRLDKLTTEASAAQEALDGARVGHWRALVRTYLYWRDCQAEAADFLEKKYLENGIRQRATGGNRPNFNPLVKLVHSKGGRISKERQKLNNWARLLNYIDLEYTDNEARYQKKPEAALLEYVVRHGGVEGLDKKEDEDRAKRDDDDGSLDAPPASKKGKRSERSLAEIRKAATAKAIAGPGIASFKPYVPVRVGGNGLLVLLARRNPDGTIAVIGSTNDADLIDSVAGAATNHGDPSGSVAFRVVVEIIRSQLYPPHALPRDPAQRRKWIYDNLAEKSHLTTRSLPSWDRTHREQRLPSSKKLLVRGTERDLLLSRNKVRTSVVTRCQPTIADPDGQPVPTDGFPFRSTIPVPAPEHEAALAAAIAAADGDISSAALPLVDSAYQHPWMTGVSAALSYTSLCRVERMIETGEIYAIDVVTVQANARMAGGRRWEITFEPGFVDDFRNLLFNDTARDVGAAVGFQADFDFDGWKPDWSASVGPMWFGQLREAFVDKWFAQLGAKQQPKRSNNQAMRFVLDGTHLTIRFNADNVLADTAAKSEPMPLETKWKAEWLHLSKDIAPVLYNLADAEIVGDATLSGNAHALVISYATQVGRYSIAVPTADYSGGRYGRREEGFRELRYG